MKQTGMLVALLRGVNLGNGSHLGSSGQNASILAGKVSFWMHTKKYRIMHMSAYHSTKETRKFRFKVKWNSHFPENPLGNCGPFPDI